MQTSASSAITQYWTRLDCGRKETAEVGCPACDVRRMLRSAREERKIVGLKSRWSELSTRRKLDASEIDQARAQHRPSPKLLQATTMTVTSQQARTFFLLARSCRFGSNSSPLCSPGRTRSTPCRKFATAITPSPKKPYYVTSPIFYVNGGTEQPFLLLMPC